MTHEDHFPDLTVVIPAYRCARYLPATAASALRVEGASVLIAENCGGDDTLAVARAIAEQNPGRVRVTTNQRNLGMTLNWQRAFESVQTPYVLYLSADDIVSTPYVRAAVNFLRQTPAVAMVAGEQADVSEDFALDGSIPEHVPIEAHDFKIMNGLEAARFALKWQPYAAGSSTIFRMSAWREVGGFNLQLGWCPDRDMWFRMGRGHTVAFCHKLTVHYRVLTTSVTANHARSDHFCFELSGMLRRARREWPEAELKPLFREQFAITAKAFAGSSLRALRGGRLGEVLPRAFRAAADFSRVL